MAFVENEAQGVDLYDRLKPSNEFLDSYYEPNTGLDTFYTSTKCNHFE